MDLKNAGRLGKNKYFWMILFGVLFFLSLDFWAWGSTRVIFGFLPAWVVWLIALQWLLSFAIFMFVKKYWEGGAGY